MATSPKSIFCNMNQPLSVDINWTLFLDRDGVINVRKPDEYVTKPEDFVWNEMAVESIAYLSRLFGHVLVVTNQQGIGKGLMSIDDLNNIHTRMIDKIEEAGGTIHKVYFCPNPKTDRSFMRKPSPGMGLKARKDFPGIDFRKSVMVGDSVSDMMFGKALKMKTIFINHDKKIISEHHNIIDYAFHSLKDFAQFLGFKIAS